MSGYGLGIGVGLQFAETVASAAVSVTSWKDAYDTNAAQIDTTYGGQSFAASDTYNAEGDSLTSGNQAGNSGDPWPKQIGDTWLSTTVVNHGQGGETTTQILADVTAWSAAQKASIVSLQGGGNDISADANVYASMATNFDNMVAQLTTSKYLVSGFSGNVYSMAAGGGGQDRYLLNRHMLDTYAEKFVNLNWAFYGAQASGSWDATNKTDIYFGRIPYDYRIVGDATHPNDAGIDILAEVFGAAVIGLDGGVPDPVPAIEVLDDTAASGATVHQMLARGTPSAWDIVGGNDDSVVAINSSGLITRSTGTIDQDFYEVQVETTGGGAKRYAPVTLVRKNGTGITGGCRFNRYGALGYANGFGTSGLVDEFTLIFRMKIPTGQSSGYDCILLGGQNKTELRHYHVTTASNSKLRVRLVDATDAYIVNQEVTGGIATKTAWHWRAVAFQRGATSVCQVLRNGTVSTTSIQSGKHDLPVDLGDAFHFFAASNTYPTSTTRPRDIGCIWMADEFIDLTDSANRDLIFNSSTLAPVGLVNGREIGGVVPEVYFAGKGPGNYKPESNRGTSETLTWNEPLLFGSDLYESVDE